MKCIDCQHRSLSHINGECFGKMTGSFIDGSQRAVCSCKRFNRGKKKLPKKIYTKIGEVNIPKGLVCFTVVLAKGFDKGSYDHLGEIAISLKDMEKFLDSVPPNKHTQEIKKKIWELFP